MSDEPWKMLFAGDKTEALRVMREEQGNRNRPLPGLGRAYLWAEDYTAALEYFGSAIEKEPKFTEDMYQLAGAAHWCLGRRPEAVELWRTGCDCDYADAAGGVSSPLLLFTAAVLSPGIVNKSEPRERLVALANNSRIENWPGPIGQYVLGRMDERSLKRCSVQTTKREYGIAQSLKANFYIGVVALDRGNHFLYQELVRKMAAVSQHDLGQGWKTLRSRVNAAEYYIARHEQRKWAQTEAG
jgi:tetratricopeptide (TPR) repeat protein